MAVDERVKRGRNTDAAFGLDSAEAALEKLRVGGMHLEAQRAFAAAAPAALGLLPAEVVHAHAPATVAEDAMLVAGAFGTKVGVVDSVLENPRGRNEMIEASGFAGGGWGGTNEMEGAVGRYPIDRDRLDEGVAVDEDDILGAKSFSARSVKRRSAQACCSALGTTRRRPTSRA